MAEELQGLLEKLHEEGVKGAEETRDKIISEADKKAESIVEKAKKQAADLKKQAEDDAELMQQRAADSIRQAARDIIIALREEMLRRLKRTTRECVGKTMTPEFMGKIILAMQQKHLKNDAKAEPQLELILNEKDLKEMEKLCRGTLAEELKKDPELTLGHDFGAGLKVGFKGDDIFFDFSDDALADIICRYTGPRLAAIIHDEADDDEKKEPDAEKSE